MGQHKETVTDPMFNRRIEGIEGAVAANIVVGAVGVEQLKYVRKFQKKRTDWLFPTGMSSN